MLSQINWSPGVTLEQIERQVIEAALRFYKGNKEQTARALDIAVRTLGNKLEKYESDDQTANANLDGVRQRRAEFLKRERGIPGGVQSVNGVDIGDARFDLPPEPTVAHGAGSERTEVASQYGLPAKTGVRVESDAESSEEPSVSVPVGKKVQGVLPHQASAGHSRKSR